MNTRQKTKIAKDLFKKSLTNGLVDSKKVTAILKNLSSAKPQGLIGILKVYKRLIESKIAGETLTIESSAQTITLKKFEKELMNKTGAQKTKYILNPDSVFGAKITIGDWVWEDTLETKLKQLTLRSISGQAINN